MYFQFMVNTNISAVNVSLHGTKAHYIRIHPINHTGSFACLRLALYGCDTEGKLLLTVIIIIIIIIFIIIIMMMMMMVMMMMMMMIPTPTPLSIACIFWKRLIFRQTLIFSSCSYTFLVKQI